MKSLHFETSINQSPSYYLLLSKLGLSHFAKYFYINTDKQFISDDPVNSQGNNDQFKN